MLIPQQGSTVSLKGIGIGNSKVYASAYQVVLRTNVPFFQGATAPPFHVLHLTAKG